MTARRDRRPGSNEAVAGAEAESDGRGEASSG